MKTKKVSLPWGLVRTPDNVFWTQEKLAREGIPHDAELIQEVELREMAEDEERIMGSEDADMDRVITNCIVAVGPIVDRQSIDNVVAPALLKGDSDWLLMELRRLSLGNTYDFSVFCPVCNTQNDLTYDLSRVEVKKPADPLRDRVFTYDAPNGTLVFGQLVRKHQEGLAWIKQEGKDVLGRILALHLLVSGGQPVEGETIQARIIKGVGLLREAGVVALSKREWLRKELFKGVCGPDLGTISTCRNLDCRAHFKHRIPVDPGFLLPSAKAEEGTWEDVL